MTRIKLDLFQLAARIVAQAAHDLLRSCGASLEIPSCPAYSFTVPDDFLRNLRFPNHSPATDTSKNSTVGKMRCAQPVIDGLFHPIRHRHCPDMPSLSYQINN